MRATSCKSVYCRFGNKLVVPSISSLRTSPLPVPTSPPQLINPSPESTELLERLGTRNTSCFFLTLANQARLPCPRTYHSARPLGAVRGCICHGLTLASATLQPRREKRGEKTSALGPGPGYRLPCLAPHTGRMHPAGTLSLHQERVSLARCSLLDPGHRSSREVPVPSSKPCFQKKGSEGGA